ncbi:MAG: decarboxylase [Candidatus Paceibacterota bacterium]
MEITWDLLKKLNNKYGESFYLLDSHKFEENYKEFIKVFRDIYPNTFVAYSYKTNYIPKLCKIINSYGGYAEVVSEMEYDLATRIGVLPKNVIFNGPYKTEAVMEIILLGGGIVNLDSFYEIDIVEKIAKNNLNVNISVGIRCNFKLSRSGASRFGFDVDGDELSQAISKLRKINNVNIAGLHCHYPNRNIESFTYRVDEMVNLSKKYFSLPPKFIDLGGGYFGKMSRSLKDQFDFDVPSYKEYAEKIATKFKLFYQDIDDAAKPKLILEPGTALAADTVKFVTRVINIKTIGNKKIATVSGSKYNISPTLNDKNLPINIYRDLNDCSAEEYEAIDIAGYTCIEHDYLYKDYKGRLEIGDYVVFDNAGSYSFVLKPPFIMPNFAIIEYDFKEDKAEIIKRKEESNDIFKTFIF